MNRILAWLVRWSHSAPALLLLLIALALLLAGAP